MKAGRAAICAAALAFALPFPSGASEPPEVRDPARTVDPASAGMPAGASGPPSAAGPADAGAFSSASSAPLEPDPAVQAEVAERLPSGAYAFCSGERYRLWQFDKDRLCGRQAELASDCPGLAAACTRPAWEDELKEHTSPSWLSQLAEWLGGMGGQVFRGLFWLLLGLGVLYLIRSLWRAFQQAQGESSTAPGVVATSLPTPDDAPSEPAAALLERAMTHLDGGDPRRALHFAYAALLAGLSHAGVVRIHRALTSGDYRRAIRRSHPESPAGGLLWDLDLARFQRVVDAGEARNLTVRVRELVTRLGSIASLVLLVLVGGCAGPGDPESAFEPTGPRGYALWEELARSRTTTFTRRLKRVTELPLDTTTVVAMNPRLRPLEWATLEHYVDDGGHLIVLGPAHGVAETFGLPLESAPCTGPLKTNGLRLTTADTTGSSLNGLTPAPADVVLSTCGSVEFARLHRYGDGQITIVGDASVFDNTSLALGDNASFAMSLMAGPRGHLEFIGPWTGSGAVHPLESIARSSVGPWLLHLLGALVLFTWWRGRRFGTPRPPAGVTRRSSIEHARALAGHYQRQGDLGAAVARYSSWALTMLGRRSGSSSRDLLALAQALTRGRDGTEANRALQAKEVHQLLLRARAGAELGGDKPKLLRAYRVVSGLLDDVHGRK